MRSMALISLSCLIACSAYAVTFEPIGFYVWQVDEPVDHYGNWDNPADWADGEVPTTDGTGLVVFPGTFGNDFEASWHSIAVESNVDIASLAFGEQVSYSFYAGQGPVSFRVRDLVDTESGEYYSDIYFGSGITFIGDGDIGFNLGDGGNSFQLNLQFGSNGGKIRGNGRLSFTSPLAIGSGVSISPGMSVGRIDFDGPLELAELGSLSVEIGDGNNNEVISDVVFANTINITATNSQPFPINLMGENGNLPTNFDPLQAYSWSVLLAGAAITNFDAMAFSLNVSSSLQSTGGEGLWALQLGSSGNDFGEVFLTDNVVMLSFTPVPEPSAFALVAVGLVLVTFQTGRRRRRS